MKKISCVLLIFALVLFVGGCSEKKDNASSESAELLNDTSYMLLNEAANAEEIYNQVIAVWHDAIFKEFDTDTYSYVYDTSKKEYLDFSDALLNLYVDSEFAEKVADLKQGKDDIDNSMKELSNVPDEYKDCYDTLKEMYKSYSSMFSLATDPSGSYNSYTSSFSELDTEFMQNYNLVKTQLPDVE